jgi:hypothetical protein
MGKSTRIKAADRTHKAKYIAAAVFLGLKQTNQRRARPDY